MMIRMIFRTLSYVFTVHPASDDDEAPMTKGQFKTPDEKLDSLLESSKSFSNIEYTLESHKSLIEALTKEHVQNLADSKTAVENSEKTVHETT